MILLDVLFLIDVRIIVTIYSCICFNDTVTVEIAPNMRLRAQLALQMLVLLRLLLGCVVDGFWIWK